MANEAWQSAFVEVLPDLSNFKKSANSEMTGILSTAGDNGGKRAGSGISTGIIGGITGALALGAVSIAGDIGRTVGEAIGTGINFALDGIDLASGLAETQSAVKEVFGAESQGLIDVWAKNMLSDFGQTQQQALDAAKQFGVLGDAAGLTGPELFNFSTDLTALASDLASFNNTTVDEAIQAIGSGLRGEAEPLRRYGILLDDATLKAKALELGIYDGEGALSGQQKTLAAQAAILQNAGSAMGDFERTSGGLANQQRILSASVEEAQTALGTALLPIVTELVTFANDELIPVLDQVIDEIGPILADSLRESLPAFKELIEAVIPLIPELVKLGTEALPPLLDLLILITPLLIDWVENQTLITAALGGLFDLLSGDTTLAEFGGKLGDVGGSLRGLIDGIAQFVFTAYTEFQSFLVGTIQVFQDVIRNVEALPGQIVAGLGALGLTLYSAGQDLITGFINGVKQKAVDLAAAALKVVKDAVKGVKDFLQIKSPSKLFEQFGVYTAEGYIKGIDSEAGNVADSMRSMVAVPALSASGMAATGIAGATGAASGVGGFNNYGTIQVTDEAALVDEVEKRKRRAYALAGLGGVKVA